MLNVKNIRDLHNNKELWNKIKVFHYDLTTFGHNLESQKRLDHEPMAFCFMSSVYFTSSELEFLLKFPTPSGTCKENLNLLIETKIRDSKKNATLCASHDLGPAFARIFAIRKDYVKDKNFKKFLKVFGKDFGKDFGKGNDKEQLVND
jgi:hypothetical protein